ncbi:MAG: HAD family hydrolase [Candidatus Bathyarchaeia archaeon]
MEKIKAVIMDLDGTIIEYRIDYIKAREEALNYLKNFDFYSSSIFDINDSVFTMYMKASKILKDKCIVHKIKDKFQEILEKYEIEGIKITKPLPGAVEAIKKLKNMNLKLAIFTANGKKPMEFALKKFNLKKYFDLCIARDDMNDFEFVKPNTQHLKIILDSLKISPYEVVVVGDGRNDMICAKSIGAMAIGVLTGISKFEDLRIAGADYIIPSLKALPKIIVELKYKLSNFKPY